MARNYYTVGYRLAGLDLYLIWFSNESDGVVVEGDGAVPSFRTQADLCVYARRRGLRLETEATPVFDFDSVAHWLRNPDRRMIDCVVFLNAWNLFGDVASSTGHAAFDRSSRNAAGTYAKLFWGNNLPAVTAPEEHYFPAWSDGEVADLHRVLSDGMRLFRKGVKVI